MFADPRFESVIGDGAKYVAQTERRFDVIIVDSTDPQGPGKVLLRPKILPVLQTLPEQRRRPGDAERRADVSATRIHIEHQEAPNRLFADASCYVAAIPTYVGGHMAMGFATNDKRLRQTPAKTIATRYRKAGRFATKYWTPEVHAAAFASPRFIADMVTRAKRGR